MLQWSNILILMQVFQVTSSALWKELYKQLTQLSQGNVSIQFQQGCDINSKSSTGFQAALDLAKASDVIAYIGGLSAAVSREGLDRNDVMLPGLQPELLEELSSLGRPTIVCMINGALLSFNVTNIGGVIEAWYGGQEAGSALADVLFGFYNPGGNMPLTFFDQTETLPNMTSYDFTAAPGRTYRYYSRTPQWSFGYGLSYTTFEYGSAKVLGSNITACSNVTVTVSVTNTGPVDGSEVIVTLPAQAVPLPRYSLQGFQRLYVEQGETNTVEFELTPYQLSYVDLMGKRHVAAGSYSLWMGGHLPSDRSAPGNILHLTVEVHGQSADDVDVVSNMYN